jgi:hypothetical protein
MTGHKPVFRNPKSIAGAALVALGMFILYQHVAGAVAELSNVLGANGSGALGLTPAIILAVSNVLQTCASNHHRLVQCLIQHTLVASWPLLLVRVGALLSCEPSTNNHSTL